MTTTTQPRYFTPDGQIDFTFISHMRLGLIDDINPDEHAVLEAYFFGGKVGTIRHLVETGDIEIEAGGDGAGGAYQAYLDGRYRQRSANGWGRKTHGR